MPLSFKKSIKLYVVLLKNKNAHLINVDEILLHDRYLYIIKKTMQTRQKHTVVVLPNNTHLEVFYYCTDKKLTENEKKSFTDLIVQLYDCHCSYKINKTLLKDPGTIEGIVQKTVINAKGHLC